MELFKIGFITVNLIDIIDIIIVTYIFYKLYLVMRGTIASQIFLGLTLIILASLIAQTFNMKSLGWIFSRLTDIWVIAFIILFQPEIRRLLLVIGRTRIARYFLKINAGETINEIVEGLRELKERKQGALIVISMGDRLTSLVETGEQLQAKVSKELLISIFNTKSPLHDGAVIINNNTIEAARCILPLSPTEKIGTRKLGTRHRAGLGASEDVNAMVIILSEETGGLSIAEDGKLKFVSGLDELRREMKKELESTDVKEEVKEIFEEMDEE
ncbi:MAG TPA: diadenylate cyclase CdaA [Ignavibacteria bacterium]|mgnify:FL=1|nr:TIGR00159 family protein [Ignavibacteria bacterium]HRE10183.1 diadenylate cyclase CdaA [Ignavibacteria bacterium]HRF65331.1 diadenylate cyclase CdaA [Ignavibacteria bacterium]HRJ03939.1 diadenylate cyclase CdaA [Ignavibacteria bacterium]HRJ85676.1 diadenylate cyclase CdaA [Ignavibacteria bacterium]